METALPSLMIDLIRDGVPAAELARVGNRGPWRALVRTAGSAQHRGWTYAAWADLVTEPKSRLGRQLALRDGHKVRPRRSVEKDLTKAWERAETYRAGSGQAWDAEQVRDEARRLATAARTIAADADEPLTDTDRAVLDYIATETERRGMLRVTLPRRQLAAALGLGERAIRSSIERLITTEAITRVSRGRSSRPGDGRKPKAAIYSLRTPRVTALYECGETPPMGPPVHTYGTPADSTTGTPAHTYGTPSPDLADSEPKPDPDAQEAEVLTLTLTPEERAAIIDALASVRSSTQQTIDQAGLPAGVVPIRKAN